MIKQKYIVMLCEVPPDRQVWLAYDSMGRIGNATYEEAFRYDTITQARIALERVRRDRKWPGAKILGTTVDVDVR
jgi:hypothetical protein